MQYDYVLAIWLILEIDDAETEWLDQLRECIETEFMIHKLEVIDEPESDVAVERTLSLQLQLTFDQSEMDAGEPTEEAICKVDREFRVLIEAKYSVIHLEILDDALASYLLAEHEEIA